MPTNQSKLKKLSVGATVTYNIYANGYRTTKEAIVIGTELITGNLGFSRVFIQDILLYDKDENPVLEGSKEDGNYIYLNDVKTITIREVNKTDKEEENKDD